MADVVIFYSSEDISTVKDLVLALEEKGLTVWWDRDISHGQWGRAAEEALSKANCVVPVWSRAAQVRQSTIHNEVAYAIRHNKPLVHVIADDSTLPIEVAAEPATVLGHWSGTSESAAIDELVARIKSARATTRGGFCARPEKAKLGNTELRLPAFVRSVSSHETLVPPRVALLAIALHPSDEPLLISAYDLAAAEDIDRTDIQQRLVELQKRAAALFLDSGNYEAYRKGARNEPQAGAKEQWTESRYHAVMSGSVYDAAFSFDSAYPSVNVREHVFDSVSQYKRDSAKTQGRPVVPIVHAPLSSAKRRTYSVLPELTRSLVNEIDPHMIAVAERELGDGIIQRAKTIQAIREALGSSSQYRMLHILGTGNLLSATVYAAAGADTFDGLEWCRTVADHDSGHLFHQQHFDFFADQAKVSEFQEVREYVTDRKRDYYLRLLVHNLDYCQKWVEELRFRVAQHSIGPMIDGFLPGAAQHLKSAIPGLL